MRSVQVYVEGMRLELFQDEVISVNSSQQNINDISKVMTDYSKTFSIPASNNNNRIFEHFYESAIDGSLDHNIRRSATIEIDLVTFRKGKVQIEKASLKNGQPESYSVTFYGETLALKDKFGDELISDIEELSQDAFSYTDTSVKDEIQNDTFGSVKFPLIVNRNLTYGDGSDTDISAEQTATSQSPAIATGELFPAVSIKTVFDAMESRYNLQFDGTFLDDDRFKKAYLYCKNAQDFQFITKNVNFNVNNSSADSGNYNSNLQVDTYIELDNKFKLFYTPLSTLFPSLPSASNIQYFGGHGIDVIVSNVSDSNETYFIDVFENGVISRTVESSGNSTTRVNSGSVYDFNNESLNSVFTFRVRATSDISLDLEVQYSQGVNVVTFGNANIGGGNSVTTFTNKFSASQTISLPQSLDVTQYMPNMKVSDFFKGILNMFNLTCYGLGSYDNIDVYQVEPLDDWYLRGSVVDITKHVDISDIEINKVPLYKNISFNYKDSKSVTNEGFKKLFNRSYGSTTTSFDYDGGEYKIELPFENLMFNRFTDTNLQVGFNIDSSLAPYIPEPTILYMYDSLDAEFRVKTSDDNAIHTLTSYTPFGQDVIHNGSTTSLNFSADNSTLIGQPSQNNLFSQYYFPYLSNLYNLKNRNINIKAVLPVGILTGLALNDRLIIRDKRYIINSMSSNISTGEVNLDLLHDFRPVLAEETSGGGGTLEPIFPDLNAQCLDISVILPNNVVSATIESDDVISVTPSTITSDQNVTVCIPINSTSTTSLILTEDSSFNFVLEDGSGDDIIQEELGAGSTIAPYVVTITYTFSNGTQASTQQVILQQP